MFSCGAVWVRVVCAVLGLMLAASWDLVVVGFLAGFELPIIMV